MDFPKLLCVSDCMLSLPVFVNVNETLESASKKLERFNVSKITVIDEDFNVLGVILKSDITKLLMKKASIKENAKKSAKNFLKNCSVGEILDKNSKFVLAYPSCNLKEIYKIMNSLKTKYLPIVKSPWNKKLEGFISFDNTFLDKTFAG